MLPDSFEIARVTLEFSSPMLIGTGSGDHQADAVCVTDANDLPTIPGTSIAGVLRHAWSQTYGTASAEQLFGHGGAKQRRSRVTTSWGVLHDASGLPVPARGAPEDEVTRFARAGIVRDHVRIGERGVGERGGKFDERVVPAGVRFTFELRVDEGPRASELVAQLRRPDVALGGRSRRGLGAFDVIEVRTRCFDLRVPDDFSRWSRHPTALRTSSDVLDAQSLPEVGGKARRTYSIELEAEDFLLVGSGAPLKGKRFEHVDHFPIREPRIRWRDGHGRVDNPGCWLMPGTGVKGALRHRTLFWAVAALGEVEGNAATDALFGHVRDDDQGVPGRVFIPDVQIEDADVHVLSHVRLDRFTMGPMDGMLYGEAPLKPNGPISFTITVSEDDDSCTDAFERALDDLVEGRLALGAGANRGHGYFRGNYATS